MQHIKTGSIWLYVGPNPGKNIPHCITQSEKDEVVTWSAFDEDPSNGGYSWLGSPAQFLKNFQPLQPA